MRRHLNRYVPNPRRTVDGGQCWSSVVECGRPRSSYQRTTDDSCGHRRSKRAGHRTERRDRGMSGVRVLVGTRKGAFTLTSDGRRGDWTVDGPHFGGLGDLPPQRVSGRPGPALRVRVRRLVRSADPALGRRRPELDHGRQRLHLLGRGRRAPVVRRHAAAVGVQADLAPRAVARRPGHGLRRRRGRRPLRIQRRRPEMDGAHRAPPAPDRADLAARRRRHVPAYDHPRSGPQGPHLRRHLGGGRVPQRRRRRQLAADQQGSALG